MSLRCARIPVSLGVLALVSVGLLLGLIGCGNKDEDSKSGGDTYYTGQNFNGKGGGAGAKTNEAKGAKGGGA